MTSWDYYRGFGGDDEPLDGETGPRLAAGKVTLTQRVAEAQARGLRSALPSADAGGGDDQRGMPDASPTAYLALAPVQRKAVTTRVQEDPFGWDSWSRPAIQRSGEGSTAENVHAAAARGLEAPAAPLPHLATIQKAFGHHDVTDVQAHVGGAAAEASAAMGATAYASGADVAFASAPDLHTAAHEAAHTVQQKGGVQLKGGVGEEGDTYERHADAVADKVVAGESAETLLDEMAGPNSSGHLAADPTIQHRAVQRQEKGGDGIAGFLPKPTAAVSGWQYFLANKEKVVLAMAREIAATAFVAPVKGMTWVGSFEASFAAGLRAILDEGWAHSNLEALLHPADAELLINQYRPLTEGHAGESIDGSEPMGPPTWQPLVGQALGVEAVPRVRESLMRLGPRYAIQAEEAHGAPVAVQDLVTSHPMDRIVAVLLCDPAVTAYRAPKARGKKPGRHGGDGEDPSEFRHGLRVPQSWVWLGSHDRKLWNWVHVTDPADITVEEVATYFFDSDSTPMPSHLAYGITASPPFFRFPPEWARMLPEAKKFEPAEAEDDHKVGPSGVNALDLADSAFATEAAYAQAQDETKVDRRGIPLAPDLEDMRARLERSERQLMRAGDHLSAWGLAWMVGPATRWTAQQHEMLAANPDRTLIKLRPVLDGQQSLLFEATGSVGELDEMARGAGVQPGTPEAAPFAQVLTTYAGVIGQSHLIDTARQHLERARVAKAMLPLDLADRSLRESHAASRTVAADDGQAGPQGPDLQAQHQGLLATQLGLRRQFNAGQPPDASSVQALVVAARENAFKARLTSLGHTLDGLQAALRAADDTTIEQMGAVFTFHRAIRDLPNTLGTVRQELWEHVQSPMEKETTAAFSDPAFAKTPDDQKSGEANRLRGRILDDAERRLTAIVTKHQLDKIEYKVLDTIGDQQIRTLVVSLVIMIGVSVAGGMAGSMVSGLVRGALLGDATAGAVGLLRGARMAQAAGTLAGTIMDAGVNTVGQVAFSDDAAGRAMLENLGTNIAVLAALRPLQDVASAWGAADDQVRNVTRWEKARHGSALALRDSVAVTGEMIGAAAVSYLVQRALDGGKLPDDQTAVQWALQGASMALGRFVSGRLSGLENRLGQLAAETTHLKGRLKTLQKKTKHVTEHGNKDEAMDLLVQDRQLHQDEARLLEELAAKPPTGLNPETIATLQAGNRAATGGMHGFAYDTMPLRIAGLEPDDASGRVWIGDRETIDQALDKARQAEIDVLVHDHDNTAGTWRVSVGQAEITIIEHASGKRARGGGAAHAADAGTTGGGAPGSSKAHTGPQFKVDANTLEGNRKAYEGQDGVDRVSPVHVDPATNTAYFEVHRGGTRTRVSADLPPRIESAAELLGLSNRIVGRPIGSIEVGLDILRTANRGDLTALAKLGVDVSADTKLAGAIEFGLGKLSDGRYVVIRGEPGAVDWNHLPGVEPLAHTHGLTVNNEPRVLGVDQIPVVDIADPNNFALAARAIVYPSPPDIVLMAMRGVKEHRVLTELVLNRGKLEAPAPGDNSPRLEWIIRDAEHVGTIPGEGDVYRTLVIGEVGGRAVVRHEVWATHPPEGVAKQGQLYTKDPSPPAASAPRAPRSPEQQQRLEARRGELTTALTEDLARLGSAVEVQVLDAGEFSERFRSEKGRAVFVLEDGVERVYVRADGSAEDIRHELRHVKQLQDVTLGAEIRKLHSGDLENWDQLSVRDRMGQFLRKLQIELDAAHGQPRADHGGKPAHDQPQPEDKVSALRELERRALAISDAELAEMSAGRREVPDFLQDPAWLFNKRSQTLGDKADRYNLKKDTPLTILPDTGPERSAAYTSRDSVKSVSRLGNEWTELIHISSEVEGTVAIRGKGTDEATIVVTDAAGKEHFYPLEPRAEVRVQEGDLVKPGDPLADEKNRRYRLVQLEFGDGRPPDMREEVRNVRGEWVQRGSESTRRGGIMEDAAKLQLDAGFAAKGVKELAAGGVTGHRRIKHQRGGGGFDDVVLVFTSANEVTIKIREVKDYPDKYVPREEFTAIQGDDLKNNIDVLRNMVSTAIDEVATSGKSTDASFEGMTVSQLRATLKALDNKVIEIEIVLGPTTKLGENEATKGPSVLRELRAGIKKVVGKDVLRVNLEEARVGSDFVAEATRKKETHP